MVPLVLSSKTILTLSVFHQTSVLLTLVVVAEAATDPAVLAPASSPGELASRPVQLAARFLPFELQLRQRALPAQTRFSSTGTTLPQLLPLQGWRAKTQLPPRLLPLEDC
jgi:hypothetical protein